MGDNLVVGIISVVVTEVVRLWVVVCLLEIWDSKFFVIFKQYTIFKVDLKFF